MNFERLLADFSGCSNALIGFPWNSLTVKKVRKMLFVCWDLPPEFNDFSAAVVAFDGSLVRLLVVCQSIIWCDGTSELLIEVYTRSQQISIQPLFGVITESQKKKSLCANAPAPDVEQRLLFSAVFWTSITEPGGGLRTLFERKAWKIDEIVSRFSIEH